MIHKIFCLIIISSIYLFAQNVPEDERSFLKLFLRIFETEIEAEPTPTLSLLSGISYINFPDIYYTEKFARSYSAEILYGFQRFEKIIDEENIIRHAREFISLTNISSHLKPKSIDADGNTTDLWRGAFGLSDGYGYQVNKANLFLRHTSAITINRLDIELPASNPFNQEINDKFDEQYRLGSYFQSSFTYQIYEIIYFDLGFEQSIIFSDMNITKWLGSWLCDNLSQRWIDIVEPFIFDLNHQRFPIIIFAVKTIISLISFELKQANMYFPFSSEKPLNYYSLRIGFSLIF